MSETREILDELKKRNVRFLLLQFTDLWDDNKAVEDPTSQFERRLAGEVTFDGSALEGFARVEEADALLVPDLETFRVFPWDSGTAEGGDGEADGAVRSEEHTSELHHLVISYAVFCLKKKKKKKRIQTPRHND